MSNENGIPIISVTRPAVQQSTDLHPHLQRTARPAGPRDFRGDAHLRHQPLEVVMRGPAQRRHISAEEAAINQANHAAAAARQAQPAPQAIDAEGIAALRVELAAVRELLAHVVARLDALDGGTFGSAA